MPDQAAPGPLAHQRAQAELAEHPGQEVAAGAGGLVDDHHLGAEDRRVRRADRLAVAGRPVAHQRPAQQLDVVVGHLAAAVEPLVDDDRLLVGLGEEIALEVGVARAGRVGHVDVGDPALGSLVDLAEVALDPGPVPQRALVGDRLDDDGAGAGAVGLGADLELDALADGPLEVRDRPRCRP